MREEKDDLLGKRRAWHAINRLSKCFSFGSERVVVVVVVVVAEITKVGRAGRWDLF